MAVHRRSELRSFDIEMMRKERADNIVGVDEAGVGAIFGPLVVAAVMAKRYAPPLKTFKTKTKEIMLNDSKRLSEEARAWYYGQLLDNEGDYDFSVWTISADDLYRMGAEPSRKRGMRMTVLELNEHVEEVDLVLVDGPINPYICEPPSPTKCLVRGDAKSYCIAAASIVAKHTRDILLTQMDEKYPEYGLKQNKGYPTVEHRQAILECGITKDHRRNCKMVMARHKTPTLFDMWGLDIPNLKKNKKKKK